MAEVNTEVLTLEGIPHDPEAAKRVAVRVRNGEITIFPRDEGAILTKLADAVDGRLVEVVKPATPATFESESKNPFDSVFSSNLDFGKTIDAIKAVSVRDIEDALSEFYSKKCESEVKIKIIEFSQIGKGPFYRPELEVSIKYNMSDKT